LLRVYSTIRTMETLTPLNYALLGLLHAKPASGYDLRKTFAETPLGTFSDSPGAIYPALRRLEQRKLIVARSKERPALRRRRELKLTPAGVAALKRWLSSPMDQADVANRMSELMLRFAFMDEALGETATLAFLRSLHRALRAYIPMLGKYLNLHSADMPRSGKLALQSGIRGYEAQAEWSAHAIRIYEGKTSSE
jgi:DNA-binding PadR family transcriptional regulator